ncbi:MAG TPA: hypothetical protein VHR27_10915 [Blastocatellia bacterium]|nr:hypothetical protein [Blastocatellia bacterium]
MKHRLINISRFLIIVATALAGCYLGLSRGWTADADPAKKAAAPMPALRGTTAIRHLEQNGFSVANSDDNGGSFSGSAYVFAPTNQPPNCSMATPSISTIWPPNHKMINVTIQGVTDPDGDPVTINIDQIKQDESTDGLGDGHTCPDGAGIGTSTAQLRAERSASLGGNGRVYKIFFTASDGQGGTCQGSVTVGVPRSSNRSFVNDGAYFDSTQCDLALNSDSRDGIATHGPSAEEPTQWVNYCLLDALSHLLFDDPLCLP